MVVLTRLTAEATPAERAWALSLLGDLYRFYNRNNDALATLREGVASDPTNAHAWDNLSSTEIELGHVEDAWNHTKQALALYDNGSVAFDPARVAIIKLQDQAFLAETLGDHLTAEAIDEKIRQMPDSGGSQTLAATDEAVESAFDHDIPRARAILAALNPTGINGPLNIWFESAGVAFLAEDWRTLAHLLDRRAVYQLAPVSFRPVLQSIMSRVPISLLADSKAEQGDIAAARQLIGPTPVDCYDCVRMRGRIDMAARDWAGAAFWFALAVREAPSIPGALSDWGDMLLRKGDPDAAVAKYSAANEKGPRFADPLEGWGEALMRANRSDLALDKFAAANRFAPNWGHLHLTWGEALLYLGRKNEARGQWDLAAKLFLTPRERTTLARYNSAQ